MRRFARGRGAALRLAAGLTGLTLAVGLSACGTSDPAGGSDTGQGPAVDAEFTRTITHDEGSTEIKAKPQQQTFPDYLGDAVKDTTDTWMTSVSVKGAHSVLDDLAQAFQVDPAK
ncbi:hypothetical protein [Plantactinospora sp. KLBMP9567]|uniref:hypothetical protein n=1 Tax=Plantactinospora sp. KLBMP9567 TaxID=3085900 RepID=UPI002981F97E|nr:hypothetical protein [Plantactinospora sp. KLBMP9567]MDW5329850.1 hypothetical protein [Plantactinospora sp. KLBMP9567]